MPPGQFEAVGASKPSGQSRARQPEKHRANSSHLQAIRRPSAASRGQALHSRLRAGWQWGRREEGGGRGAQLTPMRPA
eukprot:464770-Prymnesium_polylepis.1